MTASDDHRSYAMISLYNQLQENTEQGVVFLKCHTLGNDFILARDHGQAQQILPKLCMRRAGIGADDVVLFNKLRDKSYTMRIINPDGSACAICGNALISFGTFLFYSTSLEAAEITTHAGKKTLSINRQDGSICCHMGPIGSTPIYEHRITVAGEAYTVYYINSGTPHAIFYMDNLDDLDIAQMGPYVEKHTVFPNPTNVMFAKVHDNRTIALRCWEKGDTGETLSCGTGACAVALVSQKIGLVDNSVDIIFPLGTHRVERHLDSVDLVGRGTLSFCGVV